LIDRFFELRPVLQKRFNTDLERQLRDELGSVTIHQLTALKHLQAGPVTMRELAKELGVSESAVTAIGDRLVRQGLVERLGDPSDRRIVRLGLSKTGRRLIERIDESVCHKTAAVVSVLSDTQLAQLVDIVETLAGAEKVAAAEKSATARATRGAAPATLAAKKLAMAAR
jgi:DNA-binding MarR family transcriptional regulator